MKSLVWGHSNKEVYASPFTTHSSNTGYLAQNKQAEMCDRIKNEEISNCCQSDLLLPGFSQEILPGNGVPSFATGIGSPYQVNRSLEGGSEEPSLIPPRLLLQQVLISLVVARILSFGHLPSMPSQLSLMTISFANRNFC